MEKVLSVLPAIYDAATSELNWQCALDEFAAASGAQSATLYANNNCFFDFQIQATSSFANVHAKPLQEYLEKFADHELHAIKHMQAAPVFQRVEDDQIWPGFENMRDREDLKFLSREMGIFRRVGYSLSSSPAWGAFVALQFDDRVVDFHPNWVDNSNILAPHLGKALELNRFCSQLQQHYQAVLTVLNRVDVALFLCLPSGEVVVRNDRANEIFSDGNGIEITKAGLLQLRDNDQQATVRAYVSECGRTASGEFDRSERAISVRKRNFEDPYYLEVSPIRDGADELNDDFAGALVMIIDPAKPPRFSAKPATQIYGLTAAEAAVMELLATGHDLRDIAEIRGVALETVGGQPKAIYCKLGTRGRAEMVRKIADISPPISLT